ncbi:hypothetical protein [Candidatus Nanohalobium constans]|uniref:Uncharacterized protein n=1 Tax=Candidatus Nanohalobium constans TaxID=2565781 RepID=A0A5Q0UIU0_9ARCH|nr:hypothetical protein [Candidatus Nanohalobium constans]QGA80749.1 hypothetical protein LC1Nh_0865 [Candidatus Nanohalobium constans]
MPVLDKVEDYFSSSGDTKIYYVNDNTHSQATPEYKKSIVRSLEKGKNIKVFPESISYQIKHRDRWEYLLQQLLKGEARLDKNSLKYKGETVHLSPSLHCLLSESYNYRNKIDKIYPSPAYGGEIRREDKGTTEKRRNFRTRQDDQITG